MQTRAIFWAAVVLFGMCQLSYARIPSGLKWPLPGLPDESWIESDFGEHWQDEYCNGRRQLHTALDLTLNFAPTGYQSVYAVWYGKVEVVKIYTESWKNFVTISHGTKRNPWTATYHHIKPTSTLRVGQTVTSGKKIGTVVASNPNGAHLHIGIRDKAYSNTANRGRLPERVACGGDPAFPDGFVNPADLDWDWD